MKVKHIHFLQHKFGTELVINGVQVLKLRPKDSLTRPVLLQKMDMKVTDMLLLNRSNSYSDFLPLSPYYQSSNQYTEASHWKNSRIGNRRICNICLRKLRLHVSVGLIQTFLHHLIQDQCQRSGNEDKMLFLHSAQY